MRIASRVRTPRRTGRSRVRLPVVRQRRDLEDRPSRLGTARISARLLGELIGGFFGG
ncbi:hypothetical protein [Kitasatospora sp. NPDC057223]|uniref:hypothetical protein n=1 Tax=Kitasatospora sp. NPDC057223 TaxID=3346055 RepID=UPI00363813A4